jgi:hypothetical protein
MSYLQHVAFQHNELRRRIVANDPDLDDRTLEDTLEGLTDLQEIIGALIRSALVDEALCEGLKARIAELQARSTRLDERASKRRQIARDVMIETETKKLVAPDFTASLRAGSPALVVVDDKTIPPQFWEPRDPRLNRAALLVELKQGASVAGAQLSNPEPVLSVRTK